MYFLPMLSIVRNCFSFLLIRVHFELLHMTHVPTSLVDILRWRAKNQPHRLAYRFLVDGEYDEVVLTYEDLDRRARSIGALLQSSAKVGDRALLLFPPGLDFIAAFLVVCTQKSWLFQHIPLILPV